MKIVKQTTSHIGHKRDVVDFLKVKKDNKPPPYKRRRIGSKHKKHNYKTPAIYKLNNTLMQKRNELDDVTLLLSSTNQSVQQIANRQNRRKRILEEIKLIKNKIEFRKQNNESCKRCRERKKVKKQLKYELVNESTSNIDTFGIPPLENVPNPSLQ
eukprot:254335_1